MKNSGKKERLLDADGNCAEGAHFGQFGWLVGCCGGFCVCRAKCRQNCWADRCGQFHMDRPDVWVHRRQMLGQASPPQQNAVWLAPCCHVLTQVGTILSRSQCFACALLDTSFTHSTVFQHTMSLKHFNLCRLSLESTAYANALQTPSVFRHVGLALISDFVENTDALVVVCIQC